MGKKFSQAKTSIDDGVRWEEELPFDVVDIREAAKGDFLPIRLVGYVEPFMRFWIPTESSKAYDPYKTKAKMYPSVCVDFDSDTETFVGDNCLYRKAHYEYTDPETGETKWGRLKPTKNYVIFFINRDRQEEREGISIKKKVQQAKKQSDIQVAVVPTAFLKSVQNVIDLYSKKVKKTVDPTDEKEGYDLFFKFDPDANAEAKYTCQLGDPSPLTEEELAQVELVPDKVNIFPKDSPEKIRESLLRHGYFVVERGEDPDEVKASMVSPKKKGAMKAGVELIDDDDGDDEEEEESPKSRRKSASVEEESSFDDEDDDLDLDDEDEENENYSEANEESDDEDSDEEEEKTSSPKKSPKKAAAKKTSSKKNPAPVEDDEEDDDDFDWDDDD